MGLVVNKKTDSLKKVLSAYQTKNLNKKPH